ncbi:MAG: nitroreductase family protein [Acidobacteria bacterium]|nr:MAG: nitroreductase family protein [Acidobacteriota bacterium]
MSLSAIECILTRRSIRALRPDPIRPEDVETLLGCLEAAPSAGNLQPWCFLIVKSQALKEELCRLSFDQQVVKQAPVVFVVCAIPEQSAAQYGDVGRNLFCLQDTAAAVQNLLLGVHALGYGAVWIGVVREREIATCLGLDEATRPVALIPVGLPDETPNPMERRGWRTITRTLE